MIYDCYGIVQSLRIAESRVSVRACLSTQTMRQIIGGV